MASVAELREERKEDPILFTSAGDCWGNTGNNRSDIYLWKKFALIWPHRIFSVFVWDDRQNGESSGRVYCCYSRAAESFAHEYQLLNIIEDTFGSY